MTVIPSSTTTAGGSAVDAAANIATVRRGIEECLNRGNLAVAEEIFTADFVFHTPARPEPFRGPAGFREYVSTIRRAFPDIHFEVEDVFADGDRVVARWRSRLTHLGDFFGIPPTGNRATLTGIHVYHFVDGRIREEWQQLNALSLMQELGVLPPVERIPRPVLAMLVRLQGRRASRRNRP